VSSIWREDGGRESGGSFRSLEFWTRLLETSVPGRAFTNCPSRCKLNVI